MDILITHKLYDPFKLTAIKRDKLSVPMRFLKDKGYITKDMFILDYGCGHGDDINILKNEGFSIAGYDKYNPKYSNESILKSVFKPDIVTCNYVFNTIHTLMEHKRTIHKLRLLSKNVYISVRRDFNAIKDSWEYDYINKSYKTSKGSYQRFYDLNMINKMFGRVEIINGTSSYILFRLK